MEAALLWNILNLVAFSLSVYAAWTATSAKAAAKSAAEIVVAKKNQQEDGDRLRELIVAIVTAKDAAMRRQRNAPEFLSTGQDPACDLYTLRLAYDLLITSVLPEPSSDVRKDIKNAASDLLGAIKNIEDIGANRDGWRDALSTLQILIPSLKHEERRQRDASLLDHVKHR
jgi:hypothetical protein